MRWEAGFTGRWVAALAVLIALLSGAAAARAGVVPGMPSDVPAAASTPAPQLPEPSQSAWPFPNLFPQTSGTGRLVGGASLWSDFIYDDYGAAGLEGLPSSSYDQSSGLANRHGDYVYPPGPADNNGADIFRAGIGLRGAYSYWRVDWVTLADPNVPIAEWTFDTDDNAATGASLWPAQAGVSSPGIDEALVVSSRGAWLIDPVTGARTDVLAHGGKLTVERASKSFIVAIPRTLMPASGTWRVRLASGLADASGQSFAPPYVGSTSAGPSSTAERVYNVTFRTVAQEPPVYTDGMSDAQIVALQKLLAGTPLGTILGLDGIARSVTGNFWMDNDQADTLAGGNVSKFSLLVDWSKLAAGATTPEPQPTGYSVRWYVSRLHLGSGQVVDDGPEGDFAPTLLERVAPYAVYVPTTYRPGHPVGLTWVLHSLEVNYNQYGALDPQLIAQLCQDRDSICATTEGFGPAGWYFGAAETDFWQVWRALAQAYSLNAARTVITGYSMGGWASYKLAFEHPDDFAAALVLDGPLVCGIEYEPGVDAFASQDPACSKDSQSRLLVANARWIPYVIDQTYADELVPTTGVIDQARVFDSLGQRYDLFIHTGADHLIYATEDRFGDAVAALGTPTLVSDPASFTYGWYPSLDDPRLGIGATGDYWLSALAARSRAYGTIATVQADDQALSAPAIGEHRFGPALVTQPLPGTESGLSWQLGAPAPTRRRMSLKLTDVSALTVDARQARLPLGTVTVASDGATRLTVAELARGTELLEHGRRLATAGRRGVVSASLPAGSTVLVLVRPASRSRVRHHRRRRRHRAPAPAFTG
jgi:hypothetical protein